jgi:hypothetical protein
LKKEFLFLFKTILSGFLLVDCLSRTSWKWFV